MIIQGDLVEFRTGFRDHWRAGHVESIEPHAVTIRATEGRCELVTIQLGGPRRSGKVRRPRGKGEVALELPAPHELLREVSGARCVALVEAIAIDRDYVPPSPGGAVVLPPLRPVAKPRRAARCPAYLAYVRTWPCASCSAPGPSDAHHEGERGVGQKCSDYQAVPLCRRCHRTLTDTGRLPTFSKAASKAVLKVAQAAALRRWVEAEAEKSRTVPLLRLVAGVLLALVLLTSAACGDAGLLAFGEGNLPCRGRRLVLDAQRPVPHLGHRRSPQVNGAALLVVELHDEGFAAKLRASHAELPEYVGAIVPGQGRRLLGGDGGDLYEGLSRGRVEHLELGGVARDRAPDGRRQRDNFQGGAAARGGGETQREGKGSHGLVLSGENPPNRTLPRTRAAAAVAP